MNERKTMKIQPIANLERMFELRIKCEVCETQLVRDNYGSKTENPKENHLLGNAFGLARYGVFCNSCSEQAVEILKERGEW